MQSSIYIRGFFLFFLLQNITLVTLAQINVNVNTYTVCNNTLVDIEIRETKSTDFANNTKKQFITIGFTNADFEFVDEGYNVSFSLDGGGNASPTNPTICESECTYDDITKSLFTFSYIMTNTEESSGIDVIKITGLKVRKATGASANASASIVRIKPPIDYDHPDNANLTDAVINGSSIDDGKPLAKLISPPSSFSLSLSPSSVCIGNNTVEFTIQPVSGVHHYQLLELNEAGTLWEKKGIVVPDINGKFSVSFLNTVVRTIKYKVVAYLTSSETSCYVESELKNYVIATSDFLTFTAVNDNICIGSDSKVTFTVGKYSNSRYYLYHDQGGITPDILLGEVFPDFSKGDGLKGNFDYTYPISITSATERTYFIKAIPTSGCMKSTVNETVYYRENPSDITSNYLTSPKLILSTDGAILLKDLVLKVGGTVLGSDVDVIGTATTGRDTDASDAISGDSKSFDPSELLPGTYYVDVYAKNKTTSCRSNTITIQIKIVDGSNTLPYFLRNIDRMPICENMPGDKFKLFALISEHCINPVARKTIDVLIEDKLVPQGSKDRTITATHYPGGDGELGGVIYYAYDFEINPSQNIDYSIKVTFDISCKYDGLIPINPRRDPKLTGLPEKSTTDIHHYLCASSNDSIFMRGNPVDGKYSFYKGVLKNGSIDENNFVSIGKTVSPSEAPDNDKSLERFTPAHIFHNVLGGSYDSIIKVVYTVPQSENGTCPDSIIKYFHFKPSVDVKFHTPSQLCFGTPVLFNVEYAPDFIKDRTITDKFYWNFNDGFSINYDASLAQEHNFKAPGLYDIRFITKLTKLPDEMCDFDTIQTIRVGAMPEVDFEVRKNFINVDAEFNSKAEIKVASLADEVGIDEDIITNWEYKIEATGYSHTLDLLQGNTTFKFPTDTLSEPYKVTHIATAKYGCKNSAIYYVPIFPIHEPNNLNPRLDTFTVGDKNGWFESGQYKLPGTKSSWKNTTPNGTIIKEEGGKDAWLTLSTIDPKSAYQENERSWVESPVYSLNDLDLPMVSLNSMINTDLNYDGVALQYTFCDTSAFGKEVWYTLGDEKSGLNWYNSKLIWGLKDDQLKGWTGKTQTDWQFSAYSLDPIKDSIENTQRKLIRFRVLLGTNGDNDPEVDRFDGFAFDNFFVGQRNRKVIIEEFCDFERFDVGDKVGQNLLFNENQGYYIQYHTGIFTNDDVIYNSNPDEPSARALHYGIGKALPRGVIDGILYDNSKRLKDWGPKAFSNRSLIVSPFEMTVTAEINPAEDSIVIHTEIDKTDDKLFGRNILLHVAVVEQTVVGNEGIIFKNVLRNMVPNAAGTRINWNTDWSSTLQFNKNWVPFTPPSSDYNVIAYLQDEDTKEIYQAGKVVLSQSVVESLKSKAKFGDHNQNISFNELSIQPNPIAEDVRVVFNGILNSEYDWTITDSYGKVLLNGTLTSGINAAFIQAHDLKSGIYQLTLKGEGRVVTQKFAVVR